jgi:hypothetical protein
MPGRFGGGSCPSVLTAGEWPSSAALVARSRQRAPAGCRAAAGQLWTFTPRSRAGRRLPAPMHGYLPKKYSHNSAHRPVENIQSQRGYRLVKEKIQYASNSCRRLILLDGFGTKPRLNEIKSTRDSGDFLEQDYKDSSRVANAKPGVTNPTPTASEAGDDGNCSTQYEQEIANMYRGDKISGRIEKAVHSERIPASSPNRDSEN